MFWAPPPPPPEKTGGNHRSSFFFFLGNGAEYERGGGVRVSGGHMDLGFSGLRRLERFWRGGKGEENNLGEDFFCLTRFFFGISHKKGWWEGKGGKKKQHRS